MLAMVELRIL